MLWWFTSSALAKYQKNSRMCCIISWFFIADSKNKTWQIYLCCDFSDGKSKTQPCPQLCINSADWAKQNYVLKFSLSLAIISGGKPRGHGGVTLLSIQLFSTAIPPLLPTKCLEQILPHVPKEVLRATQAFGAVRSDGGCSHVILCKCSLESAVPSVALSPELCCYFVPFPFLLFLGMMDEFTQMLAHGVCAVYSLFLSVYQNLQVFQR